MSALERGFDLLVERFARGSYEAEVVRARAEFGERTGRVSEEDALYEARSDAFVEWYLVERSLEEAKVPPAQLALRGGEGDEEARAAWRAWATSHRSVFAVSALAEGSMLLEDLVGGAHFAVDERRHILGVAPGDILTARLLAWRDRLVFGHTFSYHPAGARASIVEHIRLVRDGGGSRADAVDHIESLRVKVEHYRHVPAERVYDVVPKG